MTTDFFKRVWAFLLFCLVQALVLNHIHLLGYATPLLFVDFVLGYDCQVAQNADWGRRPIRSDVEPVGLKPLSEITLMNYNFDYAANNAADIKEMWQDKLVG